MTGESQPTRLERTAPRAVGDCPTPPAEYVDLRQVWTELGNQARHRSAFDQWLEEPDLRSKIQDVRHMRWICERFLAAAVFGLLEESAGPDEIAELTGRSAASIRDDAKQDRQARTRRDYSVAYYERYPGRTPNEWYAVGKGDPALPELPIGVRTREASQQAADS